MSHQVAVYSSMRIVVPPVTEYVPSVGNVSDGKISALEYGAKLTTIIKVSTIKNAARKLLGIVSRKYFYFNIITIQLQLRITLIAIIDIYLFSCTEKSKEEIRNSIKKQFPKVDVDSIKIKCKGGTTSGAEMFTNGSDEINIKFTTTDKVNDKLSVNHPELCINSMGMSPNSLCNDEIY